MKRLFALILSLVMCLSLCACGRGEAKNSTEENKPTAEEVKKIEPVHTHSFSDATCLQPKMCACGVIEGEAIGHELMDGVCKYCNQAIVVNPESIDFSHKFEIYKTYSGEETYYQDLLYTYIDFNGKRYFESYYNKVAWSAEKNGPSYLEYQGNFYHCSGETGYKIEYEINNEKIIITFLSKPELKLQLQAYSDGTVKVLQTSIMSKLEINDILQ